MKTSTTFFFSLLLTINYSFAQQSKIDSLQNLLKTAKQDTTKAKLLNSLSSELRRSNPDTAMCYAKKALKLSENLKFKKGITKSFYNIGVIYYYQDNYTQAVAYYQKSLKIFEELGNKKGMSDCYTNIGEVHRHQGNYAQAVAYYQKSLKIAEELGDKKGMSNCYNNIGLVHAEQGNYAQAVAYYQKSLKIDEELGDKKGMSTDYNNIGIVHANQGNYAQAVAYYQKSLKIAEELGDKNGMSRCYNNIGNVHYYQGNYTQAVAYYQKSLKIFEELGDKKDMSYCYGNIGIVHEDQGNYAQAVAYYQKSLKILEELGDRNGIANLLGNIAELNITLADSVATTPQEKTEYLEEAVKYGGQAMEIAKEIEALPRINFAAENLHQAYKKLGNYAKALEYAEVFIETKDTMFNKEKTKALAEMEAKYQAEKKEQQIKLQQTQLAKKEVETKKQRIIIFSVIGILILLIVFAFLLYNRFRIIRKQKNLIQKQKAVVDEKNISLQEANEEILQQNAEIVAQRDEIEAQRDKITAQRDTVVKQKEEIQVAHTALTDSINYAARIQKAVLPSPDYITAFFKECFIMFRPKDIVSGDFYWATRIKHYLVVAVADCTGHGVPGAFLSMLGISFLNEIVRKEEVTQASHVLNELRDNVVRSLGQRGDIGEQKDGMDITICVIDTQTNVLQFAGANNPLYIITSNARNLTGFENLSGLDGFYEVKPDKMPVAIYSKFDEFTNHEIQLKKSDCLYLFSDGLPDQFGGPKGKKFKYKHFKEILAKNSSLPMYAQKNILEKTLDEWQHYRDNDKEETHHEQLDDITVLGIRI